MKNKLQSVEVNPLDVGIEDKEEPITEPQIQPIAASVDPYEILMQEIEDSKIWMEEFLKMTKPKKKINKKQIQQDLFEIDFLCN